MSTRGVLCIAMCALVAGCEVSGHAVLCLGVQPIQKKEFLDIRATARQVAQSLGAEIVDRSDQADDPAGRMAVRVQVDFRDARMTIQSFGSDQPLICFDGNPQDTDVHLLIREQVRGLKERKIAYEIEAKRELHLLPQSLQGELAGG